MAQNSKMKQIGKYPESIRVGGLDWRIIPDPLLCARKQICGQTDVSNQVITLDPTLSPQMLAVTFLHEIIHAVNYQWSLREFLDEKTEEIVTNSIANGLYAVLTENSLKF
jgi:hypothetical protein